MNRRPGISPELQRTLAVVAVVVATLGLVAWQWWIARG